MQGECIRAEDYAPFVPEWAAARQRVAEQSVPKLTDLFVVRTVQQREPLGAVGDGARLG